MDEVSTPTPVFSFHFWDGHDDCYGIGRFETVCYGSVALRRSLWVVRPLGGGCSGLSWSGSSCYWMANPGDGRSKLVDLGRIDWDDHCLYTVPWSGLRVYVPPWVFDAYITFVRMSLRVYVRVCQSVCLFLMSISFLFPCPSVCPSVCVSLRMYVLPCVYPSGCTYALSCVYSFLCKYVPSIRTFLRLYVLQRVCSFMCMSPPCVCLSMCRSHRMYVSPCVGPCENSPVCTIRLVFVHWCVLYVSPCVSSACLHVPSVCMSPPWEFPLRGHSPSVVISSPCVCMYVSSVCMSHWVYTQAWRWHGGREREVLLNFHAGRFCRRFCRTRTRTRINCTDFLTDFSLTLL